MSLFGKSTKDEPLCAYDIPIEVDDYGYNDMAGNIWNLSDIIEKNRKTEADIHRDWVSKRVATAVTGIGLMVIGLASAPFLFAGAGVFIATRIYNKVQNDKYDKFNFTAKNTLSELVTAQNHLHQSGHMVEKGTGTKAYLPKSGAFPFLKAATALDEHQKNMQYRHNVNAAWSIKNPEDQDIDIKKGLEKERLEKLNIVQQRRQLEAFNAHSDEMMLKFASRKRPGIDHKKVRKSKMSTTSR